MIQFHDHETSRLRPRRAAPSRKSRTGKPTYKLPSPSLLQTAERGEKMDEAELKECARAIEQKCAEFEVAGHITQINPGPVVTTFEFKPEAGIKYSRITGLGEDLVPRAARRIDSDRAHPRKIHRRHRSAQCRAAKPLRCATSSNRRNSRHSSSKLTVPLGKDLIGRIRAADLTQMPHLLIAGSTGTGKSVFINSLLMGMLYKSTPDELKLVLVDPKQARTRPLRRHSASLTRRSSPTRRLRRTCCATPRAKWSGA